jgi:hypothetical protein
MIYFYHFFEGVGSGVDVILYYFNKPKIIGSIAKGGKGKPCRWLSA